MQIKIPDLDDGTSTLGRFLWLLDKETPNPVRLDILCTVCTYYMLVE
jgi:hypothetical protein